jgi:hypothetical protein
MQTGIVTLEQGVTAPAIVIKNLGGSSVLLFVILEAGPIQYAATVGAEPAVGVIVLDA